MNGKHITLSQAMRMIFDSVSRCDFEKAGERCWNEATTATDCCGDFCASHQNTPCGSGNEHMFLWAITPEIRTKKELEFVHRTFINKLLEEVLKHYELAAKVREVVNG